MGAETFYEVGEGVSAREAFAKLVEDALYESGHGGYTGTIAEKSEFTIIPTEPFESDEAAHFYAEHLIDVLDPRVTDKWGPAGALQLPGDGRWLFFGWASC